MYGKVFLTAVLFACAAFGLKAYENYADAVKAAQQAWKIRNFDNAVKYYDEAVSLAKNPSQIIHASNLAADILCRDKNDLNGSLKRLDAIIQNDKTTPDQKVQALLKKGRFCRWKGRSPEADIYFGEALKIKSSKNIRHDLLNTYADYRINRKNFAEAEALLQEAYTIEKPAPNNEITTRMNLARLAFAQKNYDKAVKYYDEVVSLAKNPSQIVHAVNLAADILYRDKKDLNGALKKLDEIIQNDKTTPDQKVLALLKKGRFCRWRGKSPEADTYFGQALKMKSSKNIRHDLLNTYADYRINRKKFAEAEALLQEAYTIEKPAPNNAITTRMNLARLAFAQKNYDKAVKYYDEAVSLAKNPSQIVHASNLAADILCRDKNDLNGSLKRLDAIIQNDKTTPDQKVQALLKKGRFCRWRGRSPEADIYFGEALKIKSSKNVRHDLLNTYVDYRINQRKFAEAEALLQEAVAIEKPTSNNEIITRLNFARLAAAQKNYEEAEKFYREILVFPKIQQQHIATVYREMVQRCYIPQRDFQTATRLLEDVSKNPSIPENRKGWIDECKANLLFSQARSAASQKNFAEAEAFYKKIFSLPKAPRWMIGIVYNELIHKVYLPQKKTEEALKVLDEAEKNAAFTNKNWIYNMRMNIRYFSPVRELIREKKYDEAMIKLKSTPEAELSKGAKQIFIDLSADIELYRGRFLLSQKKLDEALDAFRKASTVENATVHFQRVAIIECARILMRQKKLDEAKAYIDTVISLPNQSANQKASNQFVLSDYYAYCQQIDDAIEALMKGLTFKGNIDPNVTAKIYESLAILYLYRKNDLDKAEEYHKAAYAVPKATWGKYKWLDEKIQKKRQQQQQQQQNQKN